MTIEQERNRIPGEMRAAVIRQFGEPDAFAVEQVPVPVPGSGEVLVEIRSASVNYADVVRRRNDPYPVPTTLPAILGGEVAGHVAALGDGVTGLAVGDRVFAMMGRGGLGGYAQYAVADARMVIPIPAELSFEVACTLVVAGVTAYQTLKDAGRLQPGESVFVPGALGGVGSYALRLAKVFGAGKVIAGASTRERRDEALRRGADDVVDYTSDDWPDEVRRLTGGRGADLVLNMTGGAMFEQSLAALAPFGRMVVYGTGGGETSLAPRSLLGRNQTVTGYYVSHWFQTRPEQSMAAFGALVDLVTSGRIPDPVARRLPLDAVGDAHRTMQTRQASGKLVIDPWL